MTTKHRWYYAAIVGTFVLTVAYVLTVLPGRSAPPQVSATPSPAAHSDGLSDSSEGYLMRPSALPAARGKDIPVAFHILGPDGLPLTTYETVQTRQLHLYLVRDDISGYQHLHPTLADGLWSTSLDVDDGGSYRLYAEFTPPGRGAQSRGVLVHPIILGVSFIIAGDTKLAPLPGPAGFSETGLYRVTRRDGISHLNVGQSALLSFDVTAAGAPVKLEEHLGALAHMSGFEVRTAALNHMHPIVDQLTFHVLFTQRGEYRLFLEFKVAGEVQRVAFTIFVT